MRIVAGVCVCVLALTTSAAAQSPGPMPRLDGDVRMFSSGLGQDPTTAKDLIVDASTLPRRGVGVAGGVHAYFFRQHKIVFGVGAETVLISGHAQQRDSEGTPVGFPINQRLRGFSGQFSINFGNRDGWSYLTAGMGPLSFKTYLGNFAPSQPPPSKMTINLGAGAKWFFSEHVAFAVDMRIYQTRPQPIEDPYPTRQRTQILALSAGVAIR